MGTKGENELWAETVIYREIFKNESDPWHDIWQKQIIVGSFIELNLMIGTNHLSVGSLEMTVKLWFKVYL